MKQNKVKIYAKALAQVLEKPARRNAAVLGGERLDADKIINNFIKILEKNGQIRRAKEILDLAEDLLLAKNGKRKINFQTARKITAGQKELLQSFVKDGDKIKETINPELIAGIKIIINNEKQFDASIQRKLQKIF